VEKKKCQNSGWRYLGPKQYLKLFRFSREFDCEQGNVVRHTGQTLERLEKMVKGGTNEEAPFFTPAGAITLLPAMRALKRA
jgi:hypothetical protein